MVGTAIVHLCDLALSCFFVNHVVDLRQRMCSQRQTMRLLAWSSLTAQGEELRVSDVISAVSPLAAPPTAANNLMHVNEFKIDYRPDGSVAQFYRHAGPAVPDDGIQPRT